MVTRSRRDECPGLAFRRNRWPRTGNPHLLITRKTAHNVDPVSEYWLDTVFRGLPGSVTARRLREDRIIEEGIVARADPLHLAAVFSIEPRTGQRYATAARETITIAAQQTLIADTKLRRSGLVVAGSQWVVNRCHGKARWCVSLGVHVLCLADHAKRMMNEKAHAAWLGPAAREFKLAKPPTKAGQSTSFDMRLIADSTGSYLRGKPRDPELA